jgi:hypothetical protein
MALLRESFAGIFLVAVPKLELREQVRWTRTTHASPSRSCCEVSCSRSLVAMYTGRRSARAAGERWRAAQRASVV